MATDTGPPQGQLKYMTPFRIAPDPPTPKPIPDIVHPESSLTERAALRFSLAGKHAIGTAIVNFFQEARTESQKSNRRCPRPRSSLRESPSRAWRFPSRYL